MTLPDLLAAVPLFADLTPQELDRVHSLCLEEEETADKTIFRQGQDGDKLYIILSGAVRISVDIPELGEENLVLLKKGAYFGEMALIDDAPRSASATVYETCRLLVLDKKGFNDLIRNDLSIANKILLVILRILLARNRSTNNNLKKFHIMNSMFN